MADNLDGAANTAPINSTEQITAASTEKEFNFLGVEEEKIRKALQQHTTTGSSKQLAEANNWQQQLAAAKAAEEAATVAGVTNNPYCQ